MTSRLLFMRVINGAFFYGGWLICMWAASHQMTWLAVVSTALIIGIHCCLSSQVLKDLLLLVIVCLAGTLIDTVYQLCGLLIYACPNQLVCWLAPFWITSIYALLAINLDHSLSWLRRYPWLLVLCGAGGAAATYLAGERTDVVHFTSAWTIPIIVVAWCFIFPGLYVLSDQLDKLLNPSK